MPLFTIPVVEYDSLPHSKAKKPHPDFVVNDRQLVISMVRTILTLNPGRASRKCMAAIVRPTLDFMIEWSRAPDLQVTASFHTSVRDFSQRMRIGELAQGVSHAYWKWKGGYPWIVDFDGYMNIMARGYKKTSAPDFVMLHHTTSHVAVMEAKGVSSLTHGVAMGKALRQCRAAMAHMAFSRGFGSVLTLDTGNPAGRGTLHIRDPEKEVKLSDKLRYYIFRRSYASWFDLAGDEELANWCRKKIRKVLDADISETRFQQPRQDMNDLLRKHTAAAIGFDAKKIRFELDPMVSKALASFDSFKRTDWSQLQERVRDREHSIQFPDGTIIVQS